MPYSSAYSSAGCLRPSSSWRNRAPHPGGCPSSLLCRRAPPPQIVSLHQGHLVPPQGTVGRAWSCSWLLQGGEGSCSWNLACRGREAGPRRTGSLSSEGPSTPSGRAGCALGLQVAPPPAPQGPQLSARDAPASSIPSTVLKAKQRGGQRLWSVSASPRRSSPSASPRVGGRVAVVRSPLDVV